MKKIRIKMFLFGLVVLFLLIGGFAIKTKWGSMEAVLLWLNAPRINSDFATHALLEYHYKGKNISIKVTDKNDIKILKKILKGPLFEDDPACGFSTDISITMTDGTKKIMFCPANDTCPILRIGESSEYLDISEKDRRKLYEVLKKYGMDFPCI